MKVYSITDMWPIWKWDSKTFVLLLNIFTSKLLIVMGALGFKESLGIEYVFSRCHVEGEGGKLGWMLERCGDVQCRDSKARRKGVADDELRGAQGVGCVNGK